MSAGTRVVAGIQARTGSTRLPRKVMADLEGRTLLERVVERVRLARCVDAVVVLTSDAAGDDELAALCDARGVSVRRGSETDVLSRYLSLVDEWEPEVVLRITGDCPFVEPTFLDAQVAAILEFDADFTEVDPGGIEGTLCGMGAMSARALRHASQSTDPRDREHVGTFWFQSQRGRFRATPLEVDPVYRREGLRLTVDEPADLALARTLYAEFAPFGTRADFATADVIRWLDDHPEVAARNAGVQDSVDNQELQRLKREAARSREA